MDKYVFHGDFYASDMDNMDVVLGYPWMESMGTININVQKTFLKLWYKKKKITLQYISISHKQRLRRQKHKSLMKLTHQMISL